MHLRNPTLPGLVLLLATGAPLPALEVKITPDRKALPAGQATPFRFQAQIEGAGQQPAWEWTVESLAGTHPDHGGSISQAGDYTPPADTVLRPRYYRIRASAAHDRSLTATALVYVIPAREWSWSREDYEKALARQGFLEHLAGTGDPRAKVHVDAPSGKDAVFLHPRLVAAVPGAPGKGDGKGEPDAWLVAEDGLTAGMSHSPSPAAFRLVTAGGRTETLATIPVKADGKVDFKIPQLAVRPSGGSEDEGWEAWFWHQEGQKVWRLDGHGKLSERARLSADDPPYHYRKSPRCRGLAVDAKGTLYLAETTEHGASQERERSTIRVARPGDETFQLLAGHQDASVAPRDGIGPKAVLGDLEGLVLDPERGLLYSLARVEVHTSHGSRAKYEAHLVVIDPRDGKVSTLDRPACECGSNRLRLAWFRGQLVMADLEKYTFFLIDPGSGASRQIYGESLSAKEGMRPGPAMVGSRDSLRQDNNGAGYDAASLGPIFTGFAVAPDGRIAVASDGQVGLLLLDWERLMPPAGDAAKPAGAGESKATAGESKATGVENKATGEERKETKGEGKAAQ
jgi:hypothetical protein